MGTDSHLDRRAFLVATLATVVPAGVAEAQNEVTRPVVSEAACPLEVIAPVAMDGYRGLGVLRKPPGNGPFPAVVCLHEGMVEKPLAELQSYARDTALLSRFLAAGYVVVVPTYRSRDVDPQSTVSLEDSLSAVEYARNLPFVDPNSLVVFGCSGGGDLALEVAAKTNICAVVPEEPATMMMAGMFDTKSPKRGERYTPADSLYLMENPKAYYTPQAQRIFRAKIAQIKCPILVVQGDASRRPPINGFNAEIRIPELRSAGKTVTTNIYPGQMHCFCLLSGIAPVGRERPPASWPSAAQEAFRDIDRFCRRYLKSQPKAINARFVTMATVRA